ncbi:MAG: nucleoside hydrolase [Anaerorhabdus sp.]
MKNKFIVDSPSNLNDYALSHLKKHGEVLAITSSYIGAHEKEKSSIPIINGAANPITCIYKGKNQSIKNEGNDSLDKNEAFRFIIEKTREEKLDLISFGPLTNFALAIINDHTLSKRVNHIYIMGGGHAFGNASPSAENNIFTDPEAAKIVFESEIPISLVTLDCLYQVDIKNKYIQSLEYRKENADKSLQFNDNTLSDDNYCRLKILHELITAMVATNSINFTSEYHFVGIETKGKITRGKTVIDVTNVLNKKANAKVICKIEELDLINEIKKTQNKEVLI